MTEMTQAQKLEDAARRLAATLRQDEAIQALAPFLTGAQEDALHDMLEAVGDQYAAEFLDMEHTNMNDPQEGVTFAYRDLSHTEEWTFGHSGRPAR